MGMVHIAWNWHFGNMPLCNVETPNICPDNMGFNHNGIDLLFPKSNRPVIVWGNEL